MKPPEEEIPWGFVVFAWYFLSLAKELPKVSISA
jgi:hypothetical protein